MVEEIETKRKNPQKKKDQNQIKQAKKKTNHWKEIENSTRKSVDWYFFSVFRFLLLLFLLWIAAFRSLFSFSMWCVCNVQICLCSSIYTYIKKSFFFCASHEPYCEYNLVYISISVNSFYNLYDGVSFFLFHSLLLVYTCIASNALVFLYCIAIESRKQSYNGVCWLTVLNIHISSVCGDVHCVK